VEGECALGDWHGAAQLEAEASFITEDAPAGARLVVQRVQAAAATLQNFHGGVSLRR
jgi:hypothetical protein